VGSNARAGSSPALSTKGDKPDFSEFVPFFIPSNCLSFLVKSSITLFVSVVRHSVLETTSLPEKIEPINALINYIAKQKKEQNYMDYNGVYITKELVSNLKAIIKKN
jgi:hypothetical protein